MDKNRPFLKWAGRKYNCLKHLSPHFHAANCLIEPFAGSASVFLNTDYPKYILGEENQDLIYLLQYLQQEGNKFIADCALLFVEENNIKEKYYELREKFNSCTEPRQRAIYFLYLNRHGYNGLCRYNRSGGYNVPFGRYTNVLFPDENMLFFHQKSQNTLILKQDFRKTFEQAKSGDLIYCDPPYVPIKQATNFVKYNGLEFGLDDQIELAELAQHTAQRGVTVIISNHDTEFTRQHYQKAKIHSFPVRRNISCDAENRALVQELVAVFRS